MPQVAAAPNIERTGVIAGFVLSLGGAGLIPAITKGVLFAQGSMVRPALTPILPAAPASQQSWLFYNFGSAWYWASSCTPGTAGDAFVGWVVTSASEVLAVSGQQIGETGEGPAVLPGGSVQPSEGVILPVAPGDVTLTSVEVIERFVRDGAQFQRLGLKGSAPDPLGTFKGIHVYAEIPDGCDADQARVEDAVVGTSVVGIERQPIDLGKHTYVAENVFLAVFEIPDVEGSTPARFYAVSYSTVVENDLVYADEADPTPSVSIALTPNPVVISGEEYAPNASGFVQTTGYPFYELRNNVWTYQLGFGWVAPTDSPRFSALTGYQIVFEYSDGSRAPAGWIAPDHAAWVSDQWPCPMSDTIIAWLCSQGADGQNTIIEGVTPKLTITIERPVDATPGQEYAPLVIGQAASVTVEQTADGLEVYSFKFAWGAPTSDELAQVHVWAHETERDSWHELAGAIPAEDNAEQCTDKWPLQQSCTFDIWFYSVSRDGRENTHSATVTPHVHLAQIKPSTDPTIIRGRVIPIAAPPAPASNSSTIQTATIGGVPSFRFHLVTATGGGTTAGYLAQARYYSDAGATTPTSEWIPLAWIDPALTTLDTDYWPRPAVQDYAKVRIAAQTADNALGPWLESTILTRTASTGLDGAQIAASSLVTAAFASTIRPMILVATSAALPALPAALYPPGTPAYIIDAHTLVKVNQANNAWERLITGSSDIAANTITASEIFAHTITAGEIKAGAITTTELYAGEILVGAGGGKPTRFRVNDSGGNLVAFIGDNGAGFVGAYFVNLKIGPSEGTPVISATASGVTINGAPFTLAGNGITTVITNASVGGYPVGFRVVKDTTLQEARIGFDGSNYPELLLLKPSAGSVRLGLTSDYGNGVLTDASGTSGIELLGGSYGSGSWQGLIITGGVNCVRQLQVNSVEVINSSKQFVGAGVYCPSYGIAGSGFNPYVGGSQYYGQTVDKSVIVQTSTDFLYLRVNSGVLEYSLDGTNFYALGMTPQAANRNFSSGSSTLNFKGGVLTSIT